MAPMDSLDFEVKTCSKSCLKNYETLKKQYDDLVARKHETEFKAITYKRGLDTVEAQLVTYRNNESLRKITDKSKKGFGYSVVPLPHPLIYNRPNKLDLSYSGLEEFQQPEFEVYGLRANKSVCENSSNETKKISDAPSIEEWVSDNKDEVESPVVVEKKIVVPTIPKVDVVRPKQQEKPDRKTVRYAEMYRSKGPRRNQRNWNNLKFQQLGSDFVMNNKACFVCGSFDHLKKDCGKRIIKPVWKNTRVNDHYSTRMTHSNPRRNMIPQAVLMRSGIKVVNTAKLKDAHNAVKRNTFNAVKASACWVWMPKNRVVDHVSKNINASVTLKRLDYIDAQGRFKWMHRLRGGKSAAKKKKNPEECNKSRKTKKMKCLGSTYKKSRSVPSPDPEWNKGKSVDDGLEQSWLNDMAKATKRPLTFDDLMHTPIDFSAFLDYTMEECSRALSEQLDWNNPEGHRCPYDLTKPLLVQISSQGRKIVLADFFFNNKLEYLRGGSNDKKYTTFTTNSKSERYELNGIEDMVPKLWSPVKVVYDRYALLGISHWTVIQARVEDLQLGVESYQKKLNLTKPRTQDVDMSHRPTCDTLSQMLHDLHLGYNKTMRRRQWNRLDQQRTLIMIKAINQKLLDRQIMRSMEKFVGGRDYEEDLRLLQWTI
ncbi:hypothetical protein Tco_0709605 [Tanacetum coccineum]